jgi:hypothetical protein
MHEPLGEPRRTLHASLDGAAPRSTDINPMPHAVLLPGQKNREGVEAASLATQRPPLIHF